MNAIIRIAPRLPFCSSIFNSLTGTGVVRGGYVAYRALILNTVRSRIPRVVHHKRVKLGIRNPSTSYITSKKQHYTFFPPDHRAPYRKIIIRSPSHERPSFSDKFRLISLFELFRSNYSVYSHSEAYNFSMKYSSVVPVMETQSVARISCLGNLSLPSSSVKIS